MPDLPHRSTCPIAPLHHPHVSPPHPARTIDWYLSCNCEEYWQGDLEAALRPHPLLVGGSLSGDPTKGV